MSVSTASTVTYESRDGVAILTLRGPKDLNILTHDMVDALRDCWHRFNASEDKVAILTGGGDKAFSVGANLADPPDLWKFVPGIGVAVEKPVIAAVNGICVGGAAVLVQFCDLCIMSEEAKFTYPEAKVGLSGGLITSLAARIPHKVAMEFIFGLADLDAARAYEVGLVNKVVPKAEVMDTAMAYALALRDSAPMVLSMVKRFVEEVLAKGPSERAGISLSQTRAVLESEDFAEGAAAFAEKRDPKFTGN
ncbi:enoyl-CoA hydratase/isomerase family protein [Sneathiella marina]|uniref:Enoyl-CoA hydratase/isomerase family protein n=1 Tax=Sneathiella marina TaxID=2950108 RepID=A0ABY4W5K6_9PROT|nr:enoyl-CoA hydratase/isomerase family protein [Sneathiella marina]USG60574.1 enoyl-CoA hydratase/isomerase family protein [Sneathiella marina]